MHRFYQFQGRITKSIIKSLVDAAGKAFHRGVQQAILGLSVGLFYALLLNWVHPHDIPGTATNYICSTFHIGNLGSNLAESNGLQLFETQFSQWYINH